MAKPRTHRRLSALWLMPDGSELKTSHLELSSYLDEQVEYLDELALADRPGDAVALQSVWID